MRAAMTGEGRDRARAAGLIAWFEGVARALPWRDGPAGGRDPYRVLVSEFMLQQTQVTRVAERYGAFLARFPTARALAEVDESEVLASWSGLGYYRRARHLHAAARAIVERHGGEVPSDPAALRDLPGVGRYTAGAIASIAFGRSEAIVDGNVARVLLRIEGRGGSVSDLGTMRWVWSRAHELVNAGEKPGVLNEALMELGATVCTPRAPRCGACPWAGLCVARREGRQGEIPAPKAAPARRPLFVGAVLAIDARGRRLVERRGESGLWAGLWQAPSLEREDRFPTRAELGEALGLAIAGSRSIHRFDFQTTHREVRFRVWRAARARGGGGREWRTLSELESMAVGSAQWMVLRITRQ
jgi:A/G-specific adenine glycosylase